MTLEEILDEFDSLEHKGEPETLPVVIRTALGDVEIANVDFDEKRGRVILEMGANEVP